MDKTDQKKLILAYMRKNHIGIISTINEVDHKPESAAMSFSETDDLEIIFQTPNTTRKYANLKLNPNISLVIGWDIQEFIIIQYEGIAKEIGPNEIDICRKIHTSKNPSSLPYAFIEENKYFKVSPKWLRYSDLHLAEPIIYTLEWD